MTGQTSICNNAIQHITPPVDETGVSAGKTFSITSRISVKGILIGHRGQRELGMISKNHKPKPMTIQLVNEDKVGE